MAIRRLLAVDPSLTCSGWALFDVARERLIGVGKIRSIPPPLPLMKRLSDLQHKIEGVFLTCELEAGDMLVCEAPTTMRDPRAAIKVEQVRGIFESVARLRAVVIPGRINPRTVHKEVLGFSGKQLPRAEIKRAAFQVASTLFLKQLAGLGFELTAESATKQQDIVDALLVGHVALSRLKTAQLGGAQLESFLERPERRNRGLNRTRYV